MTDPREGVRVVRAHPWSSLPAWTGLLLLATILAVVPLPQGLTPRADAAAVLSVSQDIPGETLIGGETPVVVTFENTGDQPAYNLAFSVRVPVGVTLSSADQPPSRTVVETDGAGTPTGTVYLWENVVDIAAGSVFHFRYALQHEVGTGSGQWQVNDTIDAPVDAYFSTAEATVPTFPDPGTADPVEVDPPTGAGIVAAPSAAGATTLVPVLLTKAEPSPEGELLRGVHDHQTVYTLTLETGTQGGVEIGLVEDWIPAGLEFLGCGDVDNSAGEEYPGSGPLTQGNVLPPAECPAPVTVETVDSGLPAGLAPGVYTHVVWDVGDTLGASATAQISYVAGIPQRKNTMTWPGATPGTGGAQAANLDNNTGALTTQVGDGEVYVNQAQVDTTFGGQASVVTDTESVQAVDVSEQKYVDTPTIAQGGISTWTIQLQTSEYVVAGGVGSPVVRDTTPDGTCPIDTAATACTGETAPPPSLAYDLYEYDGSTGRTSLRWDLPDGRFGPNESGQITFSTEALTAYHNGNPVSANDTWTNTTDLDADVTTFDQRGPSNPLGHDTNAVTDDSSATQSGTAVTFTKDVGIPTPGQQCGDGRLVRWHPSFAAGVGPGDRVCFRLTATAPDFLDTRDVSMVDFLPLGFNYETSMPGPDNEVPEANIANPQVTPPSPTQAQQRVDFTLIPGEVVQPAQTAQAIIQAVFVAADPPDLGTNGTTITNSARYSFQNTNGEVFVNPDDASVGFVEAHLSLTKGISGLNSTTYDPPVDPLRDVVEGDAVTYAVSVANDGERDATNAVVWDLLPQGTGGVPDATCAQISSIDHGGACSGGRITWSGLDLAAGQTTVLHYTWTLPSGAVPLAAQWTNHAGVVEYQSATNIGTSFTYVPRNNIDPGREDDANTDRADDTANVYSPGIVLTKTRSTGVAEAGNAGSNQATIGETIHYTIETRQPGGTTAQDYVLDDTLVGRGQTLVPGSVDANSGFVAEGAECPTSGGTSAIVTTSGNAIHAELPGPTSPDAGQEGCFRLTFDAVVEDAADDPGEPLNRRPDSVINATDLTYSFDNGSGPVAGSAHAEVSTQLVEPDIAIDKVAGASTTVLPGADVPYTIVVTNRAGSAVSTAHDPVVVDDFDQGRVASVSGVGNGGVVDMAAGTITWSLADLAPGASVTLTYTVRLASPLDASATIANTAEATTTSLAGASGAERSGRDPGASACSPSTCPGYQATDGASVTVAGPIFTKTTTTPRTTPGGIATYTLRAEFPRGLNFGQTTITDDLAGDRTAYVRTVSADCTNCSLANLTAFVRPEDADPPATDPPVWDLGVVGAYRFTRTWTITFEARTLDLPANVDGATVHNTADLDYATGTLSDAADVPVAEPSVTITKQVETDIDPGPADTARGKVGGTVTYHVSVTNDSDWTAYDVAVVDEPDTGETDGCTTGTPRVAVPAGGIADGTSWAVTDDALGAGDACLGFTVPVILPGATVEITYTLDVPATFPVGDIGPGPELVNRADVTGFFGLTEADRAGNDEARSYDGPADTAAVNLDGGELGNLVWLDVDGDGNGPDTPGAGADPGEPGIPGVDVTVTWFGPDGVVGGGDDEVYDRTTDADGRWLTNNTTSPPTLLPAGTFRVDIDTTTLPPGLTNSFDPDGGADSTSEVTLAEGAEDLDQDFGYAGTQSLGDRVWLDLTRDGAQDPAEPGLNGVGVSVTWAGFDGDLGTADDIADYGTATTSGDGDYTVDGLPTGRFEVTVGGPFPVGGLTETYDLDDGTTDPDGVAVRDLGAGDDATDVDFGYGGTNSVGDTVFLDTDGDGDQDLGDPGLAGVELDVTWWGLDGAFGGGDDVTVTRTTAADGTYLVEGIPNGDVRVDVVTGSLPGGLRQTFDPDGTLDDSTVRQLVGPGDEDLDADFGYTGTHEIGDLVWLDVNGDGDGPRTPGAGTEPGVPGQRVRVVWAGVDGALETADDVVLGTQQTGADGGWSQPRVPSGVVRATLLGAPADRMRVSYDREGALDGVGIATVTGDDLDFDFGLAGTGSIGDTVWLDFDEDGTVDAGEPRLPDVDIHPTWAGFDGNFGTADDVDYGTRTTDAQGEYVVANLPPGRYRVTVVAATLPAGVRAVYDLDGGGDGTAVRVLDRAEAARDVDFGYAGTGSIGDFVWWDLDGDGVQDPTEPGLADVGVTLDWAGFDGAFGTADDARLRQPTEGKGGYLFTGLPAGGYRVTIAKADLPSGVRATADPDGGGDSASALTLAGGESNLAQDFGYVGDSAIGDLVWRDVDLDGTRQADEVALGGIGITVTYLGPDGVEGGGDDVSIRQTTGRPPTTAPRAARGGAPTGDDPYYRVDGLAPGRYVVALDGATVQAPDAPVSDLDGGDPTVTRLTLTSTSQLDADFAVFRNDEPTFDGDGAAGAGISVACDGRVVIDPFAFVSDPNGDELHIVTGSIEVPADVTVESTDHGRLRIGTTGDDDFTVRYRVADGRGGTVTVRIPIEVSTSCADGGTDDGDDGGGIPLPGTGADVPPWLFGLGLGLLLAGAVAVGLGLRRREHG
ncbi:SdrD B-like domain-containing protein [Nocardioides soli]|uniref:Putative repeat protein (TIGR01451 family) n=1 Tax=Nocardioides soli TaxID=1036020 RepID=A0A7W4W0C8_9ACTN|nr:SdrD B-like domain-containing protein [Nocardioides soli]MBB3044562.1 putative repeat protein (TIGR01451 family) [Nocardioides soli]